MANTDSKFVLAVFRADGSPVYLRPGGSAERDLKKLIGEKLALRPVGLFSTKAQVIKAWEESFAEALTELKSDILPVF